MASRSLEGPKSSAFIGDSDEVFLFVFLICREIVEPRCFIMFLICLPASLNVRTEPQSEIGRNRGKKQLVILMKLIEWYFA